MIIPFLNLNGKTAQAVPYYAEVFELKPNHILTFNQAGDPGFDVPADFGDKAMFTFLDIDSTRVMICDHFPGIPTHVGASVSLNLITSRENIDRWFPLLASEGSVGMERQETKWSKYYGSLTDKFGIVWQFSINEA